MTIKITPGGIESDGHVVLLPATLTGIITLDDGTTYNLGDSSNPVIETQTLDHAKEAALLISQLAHDSDALPDVKFDEAQSRKNLGLNKKKG